MATLQQSHLEKFYRPFVALFFLAAALIFGGVVYAGSASTVITATTVPQPIKTTITITVGPKTNGGELYLTGQVVSSTEKASTTAKPSGAGPEVPAHAHGTITFHNETNKTQPLTTGTRVQSASGIIFRTQQRVDVPAGGTITTDVVADPVGKDGEVDPGHFVIVALWPGLQSKIYATSDQAFTGGLVQQAGGLGVEDLTKASNEAEKEIRQRVGSSQSGKLIILSPTEVGTVPPSDQPSDSYAVTVSMKVLTITYPAAQLESLIRSRIGQLVPDGQVLQDIQQPELSLHDQPTSDEVVIDVNVKATSVIDTHSSLLDSKQLTSLTEPAVSAKLSGSSLLKNIVVKISPPWRTVTSNRADRVTVRLVNP